MSFRWKISLLLTLLVAISFAAGALLGIRWQKTQSRKRSMPGTWNEIAMRGIERRIDLTPEQREKIQKILDSGVEELHPIRTGTLYKTNQVVDRLVLEISATLTPEQLPEFEKLNNERKQSSLDLLYLQPKKAETPNTKPETATPAPASPPP
jgi:hypothetical protein